MTGSRGTKTGKLLWEKLYPKKLGKIMTDYWKSYSEFIPKNKHIQSKAETFTVEGYNSIFRGFLARLTRKTKAYSKSEEMLNLSIKLLILKWNDQLDILR